MRKLYIIIPITLSLLIPINNSVGSQKPTLNVFQQNILYVAKTEGHKVGYGETMQAIVMAESIANVEGKKYIIGDNTLNFGKKSYGVAQVKLQTAKYVLDMYKHPRKFATDEDLLIALLFEPEFNLEVASLYFEYLMKRYKGNWKKAVVAYNEGPTWVSANPGKVDNHPYLRKVNLFLERVVRPHNKVK